MDMDKTTILLPTQLRKKAAKRAATLGISLGELIRRNLTKEVQVGEASPRSSDPIFDDFDALVLKADKTDVALEHDRYLYEDFAVDTVAEKKS